MQLPKLNFKEDFVFDIKQRQRYVFIYDMVRKSWLVLTPEEWVRQHFVHYFTQVKKLCKICINPRKKLELNGTIKRIDLLITEKTAPKILVELKAPHITLTEQTFEQIARYNSVIGAEKIILSNGLQHIAARFENGNYHFENVEF